MEKEHQPDSMATINMKPEYTPSEVYSASEPPPAYRSGGSTSVQIARIVALTVVASCFILGSFILASSWVAARASCHQLEQLDAMLDKELALEGRAYGNDALLNDEPLPVNNAHALHAPQPEALAQASPGPAPGPAPGAAPGPADRDDALARAESKIHEDNLQKLDNSLSKDSDESAESDSSAEEDDDLAALKPVFKLPVQFDLDELAGAFLANSQKGRMNCVVERRHEEPLERRFPFNILSGLGALAPRAPAERVAIICHGGDEPRAMGSFPEPQSQVFAFPMNGPSRLPLRPEQRTPFAPMQHRQPFPMSMPMPMPWDSSEEQGSNPHEMRIHVQRVIAIPAPHHLLQESLGPFAPPPPPQQSMDQNEPAMLHQYVPQTAPTQDSQQNGEQVQQKMSGAGPMGLPWELTPGELDAMQAAADDAADSQQRRDQQQQIDSDMQEVKTIMKTLVAAEAEAEAAAAAAAGPRDEARTLLLPQELPSEERPHYVQPRSVRSVDGLLHREKRVKRCACDCSN